ncbi:nitrite reductase large subunit NirB [Salinibius halmophilus]|uniref:nitrite reductase large subunit NirB n=1 Tax=Salinibius halmophilus TaxID=1853216 RepID=UPI000E668518|nr:nitrite reductase large subunit NirB [Salinibius halmophilus]
MAKPALLVIGNGMVGQRFLEELVERDAHRYQITVLCEEPRAAYDRVHLSSYFSHHTAEELSLVKEGFFEKYGINLLIGERAITINQAEKVVHSSKGRTLDYDKLVFATGAYPWIPPIEGRQNKDCFVYRTIEDLNAIEASAKHSKIGVVVGGGLLGLEAAGALKALGLETHVVEFAPVLMAEQLDQQGGELLRQKIESMGVAVHTSKNTSLICPSDSDCRNEMRFADGSVLATDIVVFSTGIRPQDKLARQAGLAIGQRGGIAINDQCQVTDDIYAIGECASWQDQFFGLVAPGYAMARVVADDLTGKSNAFAGADMSAKLKLLGVEVGSIGQTQGGQSYVYLNEKAGIYKRLIVDPQSNTLLGAVLVGDTSSYGDLLQLALNAIALPQDPQGLIMPTGGEPAPALGPDALPASAVLCSCFDVTKGQIQQAVGEGYHTIGDIKAHTKAGTGCGGCIPLITQVLNSELAAQGLEVNNHLCAHFEYSRQELFHLIQVDGLKSFNAVLSKYGQGGGCEVCKPAIGSILASCWNDYVLTEQNVGLQDTNDVFLGNMQKDGSYSVIPRMPGGEVTPVALAALANLADQYGLYTKVTGAQRIGLFGAQKQDLPDIWQQLIGAGFETGHAYAKSLRMVKTCVGSTWCRFGVQDSVGLGVQLEHRYKGIRAPHKLKLGVSGCTRECAEAQGKDIGVIATDAGWNLFVGGNGGMKPRHGDLFATDLDTDTLLRYIDRILMFYIRTADKLQRMAPWLESLDGGVAYLQAVIIDDKLGLVDMLERQIDDLREAYQCEWQTTLSNEQALARFKHFINSDEPDPLLQFVPEREQKRPAKPSEREDIIATTEVC